MVTTSPLLPLADSNLAEKVIVQIEILWFGEHEIQLLQLLLTFARFKFEFLRSDAKRLISSVFFFFVVVVLICLNHSLILYLKLWDESCLVWLLV